MILSAGPLRILLVSDVITATQHISFLRPLAGDALVTPVELNSDADRAAGLLDRLRPDLLLLSRATRIEAATLSERARHLGIPSIFHIDDNLLAVPETLGPGKYKAYNDPARLANLRSGLEAVDIVYVSTPELRRQLMEAGITTPITSGRIYCALSADEIPDPCPPRAPAPVIGYMGTGGHAADLAAIAPAIAALMAQRPGLRFELFGGLRLPADLAPYSDRITIIPPTRTYAEYLEKLASLGWWAGLAPLQDHGFNRCKADTKWVEYTRGGIPVVAADLPVYGFACAEGAGRLAGPSTADWEREIAGLLDDPDAARTQVEAARARLRARYDLADLRAQALEIFDLARRRNRDPGMPLPEITQGRRAGDRGRSGGGARSSARSAGPRARRLLFVADAITPTLRLSFLKPLSGHAAGSRFVTSTLTGADVAAATGPGAPEEPGRAWIQDRIAALRPDIILFCRYSGPHASAICDAAADLDVPVVVHVDDDPLDVPGRPDRGPHDPSGKRETARYLLEDADLVYCATAALERRLRSQGIRSPIRHGTIHRASRILREPGRGPVRRLGYMGGDHDHDFDIARPAVEAVLDRHPEIEFELFGSIPMPQSFARFGARVRTVPAACDDRAILERLADRAWDVGLRPLARTPFNAVKPDTGWVGYTAAGMAVVASGGMACDHCMRGGRGLLVDDGEWTEALELLITRPRLTRSMARASQRRLLADYSETALQAQVVGVLDEAWRRHSAQKHPRPLAGRLKTIA